MVKNRTRLQYNGRKCRRKRSIRPCHDLIAITCGALCCQKLKLKIKVGPFREKKLTTIDEPCSPSKFSKDFYHHSAYFKILKRVFLSKSNDMPFFKSFICHRFLKCCDVITTRYQPLQSHIKNVSTMN